MNLNVCILLCGLSIQDVNDDKSEQKQQVRNEMAEQGDRFPDKPKDHTDGF
ncbi:hypothetical protein VRK_11440 [Vibrio sp. MEBiC08052]|nr:hypothetical protein VRK_11440 [Vibrio sp. MEBiC08052]